MKKTNISRIVVGMIFAISLASCSSSTSPTSTNTGSGTAPANTIILTVSGKADTISIVSAKTTSVPPATVVTIVGGSVAAKGVMSLIFTDISATGNYGIGTYTIAIPPGDISMSFTTLDSTGSSVTYTSPTPPGTTSVGTFNISTLSATSLVGTFSATLTAQNSSKTISITNGSINATIN